MFDFYQPTRLHFGVSRLNEIGNISKKYGKNCLLITTNDSFLMPVCEKVAKLLCEEDITVHHFSGVVPNPTIESVQEGLLFVENLTIDFVVALGGGSTIDTAKAICFAYHNPTLDWTKIYDQYASYQEGYADPWTILPLLSVPTTSGTGSHVTHASVLTFGTEKITMFHPSLFSKEAIIDPKLMLTLPASITAATAFDAFTHAFESYLSVKASPLSKMDSLKAMQLVIEYLPKTLAEPSNLDYRSQLSIADTLGGRALANAGASTPHPLSEIIGGIMNIPHGEALAVVYPSFIRHSVAMYQDEFEVIAQLFGAQKASDLEQCIADFLEKIGLLKTLSTFAITNQQFDAIVNHPVLGLLPYGPKEYFVSILNDVR